MLDIKAIIKGFQEWFVNDPHSLYENHYDSTFNIEYLSKLSTEEFIDYFNEFAREGGKIQSGGKRTANLLKQNITNNFEEFRTRILDIFENQFDIEEWMQWVEQFNYFGQGLATIILNRKDRNKFVIVNNKSIDGLNKLGYNIKKTNSLYQNYISIYNAESELLKQFPELRNYYIIDAMMHFMIGTDEGISLIGQLENGRTFTPKSNSTHKLLNQILYGPPGTGKTFNTISRAVAIIEEKDSQEVENETDVDFKVVKERFDAYLKAGKIVFTTFHQSMAYEDFIEGIKPKTAEIPDEDSELEIINDDLTYIVEDGIFKMLCKQAKTKDIPELNFDQLWESYTNHILNTNNEVVFTSVSSEIKLEREFSTSKSLKIRFKKSYDINETQGTKIFQVGKEPMRKVFEARIDLSNQTLKKWVAVKNIVGAGRATTYYAVYKSFFEYSRLAELFNKKNDSKPYVMIIDEINRGNISQIFGELITLIEDDKREGMSTSLSVTLPYSKESFSVPSNVYIIGTMNTADRSVEALDTALRRRFSFVPKMPEENRLTISFDNIILSELLKTINERLRILKDNDHTIGHAWLMGVKDFQGLKKVFADKILPLLQEYFYNDFEKLGLILGDGFFNESLIVKKNTFADFKPGEELASRYYDLKKLTLKDPTYWTKNDFLNIYSK